MAHRHSKACLLLVGLVGAWVTSFVAAPAMAQTATASDASQGGPKKTPVIHVALDQHKASGLSLRPCPQVVARPPEPSKFSIALIVTTDSFGRVRKAVVAPFDMDKMRDPLFAAYARRVIDTVMNYQCATLPLPSNMLGQNQTFLFNFTPGS